MPTGLGTGDLLGGDRHPQRARKHDVGVSSQPHNMTGLLWLYERGPELIRLEMGYENDRSVCATVVIYPDGREHTARFSTVDDFRTWLKAFDQLLREDHWADWEGPIVVSYRWEDRMQESRH